MTMADASSFYNDDDGAEEDEVATDIGGSKIEDFATRSLSIRRDNAAMMMDEPLPLLTRCPPPRRGSLLQRNDRTAGKSPRTNSALSLAPWPAGAS
jgi:hypothetical protein